jgi:hypothetical protein
VNESGDHAGVKNLNLLTVVFENGILNSIMTTLVLLLSRSRAREHERVRDHDYVYKLDEVRERTH